MVLLGICQEQTWKQHEGQQRYLLYFDKKKSTCTSDYRCNKKAMTCICSAHTLSFNVWNHCKRRAIACAIVCGKCHSLSQICAKVSPESKTTSLNKSGFRQQKNWMCGMNSMEMSSITKNVTTTKMLKNHLYWTWHKISNMLTTSNFATLSLKHSPIHLCRIFHVNSRFTM